MGDGRVMESGGTVSCQHDLSTPAVGRALLATDETPSLHTAKVVGQAAAFPGHSLGELRRPQPLAGRFAESEQYHVVPG